MVYRHEGFGTLSHMRVSNYQVITPTALVNRPTSPTFDVRCTSTKMAAGVITAVIGKEPIPTGFDANNTGSCSFSRPVSAIRIRLWYGISDKSDNQTTLIQFDEPVRDISFPLPDHVLAPIVKADLSQGPYLREVSASSLSGEATGIPGFSNVELVTEPVGSTGRPAEDDFPGGRITMTKKGGLLDISEEQVIDSTLASYSVKYRRASRPERRELQCAETALTLEDMNRLWRALYENDVFELKDNGELRTKYKDETIHSYQVTVERAGQSNEFSVYNPWALVPRGENRYNAIVKAIEDAVRARLPEPASAACPG